MTQQELTRRLATLTAEPPRKTIDFFRAARTLLQEVGDEIGIPIIFASVTTLGRLVLPIWAAPREFLLPLLGLIGFEESDETALNQLNDLVTFMLIQKYRTGSAEDLVEEPTAGNSERRWLFSEVSAGKRGRFLRAVRGEAEPRALVGLTESAKQEGIESCLRRSTYRCQWVGDPDQESFDLDAYTPWFGEIRLGPFENPMRRLLISPAFFQRHETTPHAAALYLFLPGEDESEEADQIEKIEFFFPQLTMLAARINEELRAQVTSAHPRYCSRYFQVVLGKSLFPLFQRARKRLVDGNILHMLVREAAKSLFDNRVHPVATRRLIRELAAAEGKSGRENFEHEFFDPIIGSGPVEKWLQRPDAPPVPAAERKRRGFGETRVVAAASPRGGVGKTLLAYNIARMLVERRQRVLLIELDAANPTVYFIDSDYRTKVHHLKDFALMRENRFDPVAGARGDAARANCAGEGFLTWTCELKSGLHVLGALPGIRDMAEMLAADTSRRKDRSQMDALLTQIRNSKRYDWVIIDTPAGFRDLANAAVLSSQLDLLLLCSFPTKPSLLSMLVGLEVLHANGVTAKQMLVLNECREMDVELYKDRASIADFTAYWMRNGGISVDETISDVGIIDADKIVRQISNLPPVSAVSWDDFAARLETDLDYEDVGRHDFGLKQLVAGIIASTRNA